MAAAGGQQAQQQRGMFIQTQPTPNPSSLMFMPGQAVMEVRAGCHVSLISTMMAFFELHAWRSEPHMEGLRSQV